MQSKKIFLVILGLIFLLTALIISKIYPTPYEAFGGILFCGIITGIIGRELAE